MTTTNPAPRPAQIRPVFGRADLNGPVILRDPARCTELFYESLAALERAWEIVELGDDAEDRMGLYVPVHVVERQREKRATRRASAGSRKAAAAAQPATSQQQEEVTK